MSIRDDQRSPGYPNGITPEGWVAPEKLVDDVPVPGVDPCPRCGGTEFTEHEGGSDTAEDFVNYTSESCNRCGLWYDGWRNKWLIDVDSISDEEGAEEYVP